MYIVPLTGFESQCRFFGGYVYIPIQKDEIFPACVIIHVEIREIYKFFGYG